MSHGATIQYATSRAARDAILSGVTGSENVISVRPVGGYETFGSVTQSFGLGGVASIGPVDNTIWELVISNGA